jgi:hypothetical protein
MSDTDDLADLRLTLLDALDAFGPQPSADLSVLAEVVGATDAVFAGLAEAMIEAGEIEVFAGSLRLPRVAA